MTLAEEIKQLGKQAVNASRELVKLGVRQKNDILLAMAGELDANREIIKQANARDMQQSRDRGLSAAMLDRLELRDSRIDQMINAIHVVAELADPIGQTMSQTTRPNGLQIKKQRVPIGVIAIIYESRPNVTADAAVLCIKTSNAVILRGGTEANSSNLAIAKALQLGGERCGLPKNSIQLIETTEREAVQYLVQLEGLVDLVIPRGGEELIKAVAESARVPVIKHYKGVCHTFVDQSANLSKALEICENAKCQRPGVCNAMETLLVHDQIAEKFLPSLAHRLEKLNVELRGDEKTQKYLPGVKLATEADWYTEYLDLILSIRLVSDVEDAVNHINTYGSHHSDAIITENDEAKKVFTNEVDSGSVYVNASTRFTDGAEFGMGAEIGISTDKIHARGPMGLEELTTYKYIIEGDGQIRS